MGQERKDKYIIQGQDNGNRIESRILEERIQEAVSKGERNLEVRALGHHGIGGRLWQAGDDPVKVTVTGPPGQRLGSMGSANTWIEVNGNASEDVGWLNAGAEIVIHGHAGNGVANAMAQGRVSIAGNIGARGMTMTKHNPRFSPPELWVLGSVGDYFAEFMAGGRTVICGYEPQNQNNVLGYRPCVGMVGGTIYLRGHHQGFSQVDAKQIPISDQDWQWLFKNLKEFLQRIDREEIFPELAKREDWQLLAAKSPFEKKGRKILAMKDFQSQVWDRELGSGGLIGDLTEEDRSPIPLITTGDLRRFVPVWENKVYLPPCEESCPTGIPVQRRWQLIREGRVDEAVDMAMAYTPFPATVCGYLCPNLCMQGCTRKEHQMAVPDISMLGKASLKAQVPELPPLEKKGRIAVIGGGPGGISAAWQLRMKGYQSVIYDRSEKLGGKIRQAIPRSRIPDEILSAEMERIEKVLPRVNLKQDLDQDGFEQLKEDFDFLILAMGAQKARLLQIPGKERLVPALDFLQDVRRGVARVGKKVVIIGAGNVGCDVATEAKRLGAEEILLIDIQEPASFGPEREAAEKAGARFRWPVFTKEITEDGLVLTTGEHIPADTVVVSVGDQPELDLLPKTVETENGFVKVDQNYQTSDNQIFAIGDLVRPGLITEAIGAGRKAVQAIDNLLSGTSKEEDSRKPIDKNRVKLEYYDPRVVEFQDLGECAGDCASCGVCRDCGLCVALCPQGAISRKDLGNGDFEMVVDDQECIGCGFCAAGCPCGIWNMMEKID